MPVVEVENGVGAGALPPPKGVGALLASGGYELLAGVVVDFTPPNGVGAFADIGGKAADPVVGVDPKVVALAPNGVGAVLERGG